MAHLSEEKIAEIWSDVDSFTLNQAAALWVGESPPEGWIDDPAHPHYDPHNLPTDSFQDINAFKKMLSRLQKAIGNGDGKEGKLKVKYFSPDNEYDDIGSIPETYDLNNPHPEKSIVSRLDLTEWAEKQGQYPLFLFSPSVENHRRMNVITSCLDKNHKYYSRELAIAIEAWNYFYNEEKINTKAGHVDQITGWLEKNYTTGKLNKDLRGTLAIGRITTMINRGKQGKYENND
jgi:hypothetical protein